MAMNKRNKFNIYNWCAKKSYEKVFDGVFHNTIDKVAVSSDKISLVISKDDYVEPSEDVKIFHKEDNGKVYEGYIINRRGKYIDVNGYADYKGVFNRLSLIGEFEIDREKLSEMLNSADLKYTHAVNVPNNGNMDLWLTVDSCNKLLTLPEGTFKVSELYESRYDKLFFESERITALFMILDLGIFCGDDYYVISKDFVVTSNEYRYDDED